MRIKSFKLNCFIEEKYLSASTMESLNMKEMFTEKMYW